MSLTRVGTMMKDLVLCEANQCMATCLEQDSGVMNSRKASKPMDSVRNKSNDIQKLTYPLWKMLSYEPSKPSMRMPVGDAEPSCFATMLVTVLLKAAMVLWLSWTPTIDMVIIVIILVWKVRWKNLSRDQEHSLLVSLLATDGSFPKNKKKN